MTNLDLANSISHEYRVKILMEWLPAAQPNMQDKAMQNLFSAYFIYVEPNAIPKSECLTCVANVLKNWISLKPQLVQAEQNYNLLNAL